MREFNFALKQTVPIFFTYLFIGVAFGALMSEAGYGILLTVASAVLIYAGSMQLLMVPMLAGGAPLWSLAVTALLINARHIFYGVGFIERFRKMGWRAPYMVLSLTDETYSLLSSVRYEDGMDASRAAFWIAALDHIYWIFGCLLGAAAGRFLPFDLRGLEFSATAFFLVVVVDQWRMHRSKIPFITALVGAACFLLLFGRENFLIPTLLSSAAALLLLRSPVEKKEAGQNE